MCDSHISESCPMDFTSYCPVDTLCSDGKLKQSPSHTKNHITWISRKAKGASNKQVTPSKQENRKLLQNYGVGCYNSHRDDKGCNLVSRSLEKPSPFVSQKELNALKGCVMRTRAVFSPSPSSSPVHSYACQQLSSPNLTNSLPVRGKHLLMADEASHVRQGSFEYDHLKDFDPYVPVNATSDSVSVQFQLQEQDKGAECSGGNDMHEVFHYTGVKRCGIDSKDSSLSYSKPERLDYDDDQDICSYNYRSTIDFQSRYQTNQMSASCDLLSLQRCCSDTCSGWFHNEPNEPVNEKPVDSISPMIGRSNVMQQQQSPFHSKYSSPLLSKHQIYPFAESMKTCDTGSNYSLYSQTTTVSSLTDRQHCSYSKGVDGNFFKKRTDVSAPVDFWLLT